MVGQQQVVLHLLLLALRISGGKEFDRTLIRSHCFKEGPIRVRVTRNEETWATEPGCVTVVWS